MKTTGFFFFPFIDFSFPFDLNFCGMRYTHIWQNYLSSLNTCHVRNAICALAEEAEHVHGGSGNRTQSADLKE
jgi:hypothetical protein